MQKRSSLDWHCKQFQLKMVYTTDSMLSMLLQVCWEQRIDGVFA